MCGVEKGITSSLESSRAAGGSQDLGLGLFEKSHHRGSLARSSFDAPDGENISPKEDHGLVAKLSSVSEPLFLRIVPR